MKATMKTTEPPEMQTDYSQPRTVWQPTEKSPIKPWSAWVPLMLVEGNDLSAMEFRVWCQLVARTNGDKDYSPFGEDYLASKIGVQPRTWRKAAESLEERGMIAIQVDGRKKKVYEVLWHASDRRMGDPEDYLNPPIRLGPAPILADRPSAYAGSRDGAAIAPQVEDETVAEYASQSEPTDAEIADGNAKLASDAAPTAPRLNDEAGGEGMTVGHLGDLDDQAEWIDGQPESNTDSDPVYVVDPSTGEIIDTTVPDTVDQIPEAMMPLTPVRRNRAVAEKSILSVDHGRIELRTPYNGDLWSDCKRIEGYAWDPVFKRMTFPAEAAIQVCDLATAWNIKTGYLDVVDLIPDAVPEPIH